MANFEDILDKPATEIDRPKPLPIGEYVWTIQGLPRYDKSKEKQTPFYEFTCKLRLRLTPLTKTPLRSGQRSPMGRCVR